MKKPKSIKELNEVLAKLNPNEQLGTLAYMYNFIKTGDDNTYHEDIPDEVVQESKERIRKKLFGSSK